MFEAIILVTLNVEITQSYPSTRPWHNSLGEMIATSSMGYPTCGACTEGWNSIG